MHRLLGDTEERGDLLPAPAELSRAPDLQLLHRLEQRRRDATPRRPTSGSSASRDASACAEAFAGYLPATARVHGDADIAGIAAAIADPRRARILLALGDGRALPASLLAAEAGVAASTASEHLRRLERAGLVSIHPQGRHRYFRLRGPEVAELIESLSRLAPPIEVRSLRQGTRAQALRRARTCYDHLAGRLGVAIFRSLLESGGLTGGDGLHRLDRGGDDRLSAPGRDLAYRLTRRGRSDLEFIGVVLPPSESDGTTPVRYCVDWTEQRHHLSGAVGRALAARLFELGWLERGGRVRAVEVTAEGNSGLRRAFGATVVSAAGRAAASAAE